MIFLGYVVCRLRPCGDVTTIVKVIFSSTASSAICTAKIAIFFFQVG